MSKFGNSGNEILDEFILKEKLKWIPYNQFKNVEYLDKGGFSTIYKAIWVNSIENVENVENAEVVLKCVNNLNENLDEFLKEWKCLANFTTVAAFINLYGFTKNPNTLNYMAVMDYANKGERPEIIENTPQCYVDLMKKCWDEDPLKRPSSVEVKDIFNKWIYLPDGKKIEDIDEEDLGSLDENNSKNLNEILESKDSQASVKANEILVVSEDLNDCIIKDLGSLDIETDEN
ncbi:kinase-like domain-containing protein [Rhizophagus irregularis DAOM 181602=DAOM 197198]|nr:kinase-like domain-containing protein [Rhizophagus irregularis DAOM 181602=DAOM 197198]